MRISTEILGFSSGSRSGVRPSGPRRNPIHGGLSAKSLSRTVPEGRNPPRLVALANPMAPKRESLKIALLFPLLFAGGLTAEEINLESTVIGNQEQPKVLYIIPWKQADSLQRLDSTLPQTVGDVFRHQEYSEFQREIKMQVGKQKASDE